MKDRLKKKGAYLDKHVFYGLTNLNDGFDAMSIKYFSETDFKIVLDRVKEFGIGITGIEPWKEREWVGKIIKINEVSFKVEKNIPRCVAINLKPQSDDNSFNLLQLLKKIYGHFEMGIYLTALDDGDINIGNSIDL